MGSCHSTVHSTTHYCALCGLGLWRRALGRRRATSALSSPLMTATFSECDSQVLPPFGMVDSSRLQGSRGGISPADRIRGGLGFSTACALIPIGFMLLASGGGAQRTPSLPRLAVRFGLAICFRLSVPGIQRVIGCFLPTGFSSYDKDSLCSACCWLQTSSFGIRAVWMVS